MVRLTSSGTVVEREGFVDTFLSLPMKVYQFLMFFFMTLIDVRAPATLRASWLQACTHRDRSRQTLAAVCLNLLPDCCRGVLCPRSQHLPRRRVRRPLVAVQSASCGVQWAASRACRPTQEPAVLADDLRQPRGRARLRGATSRWIWLRK